MQLGPVDCLFIRTLQPSLHPNPIKSTIKSWHSTQEPAVEKVKSRTHYKKKVHFSFSEAGVPYARSHSFLDCKASKWIVVIEDDWLSFYLVHPEIKSLLQRYLLIHASPSLEVEASRFSLKVRMIHLAQWKTLHIIRIKEHLQGCLMQDFHSEVAKLHSE